MNARGRCALSSDAAALAKKAAELTACYLISSAA